MYEDIEGQTGVRSERLDGPPFPQEASHVWGWFEDLSGHRQFNYAYGTAIPQPISYADINHYFSLIGENLKPWQRRLLSLLDQLYRTTVTQRPVLGAASKAEALKRRHE